MTIQFKALSKNDLELLYHWFQEPVIKESYASGKTWQLSDIQDKYLPRIIGKETIPSYIMHKNNNPIGFIQYYCLKDYLPEGVGNYKNPLFKKYSPDKMVGIDLFIAEKNKRGQGLGGLIINQFIETFLKNYEVVVVDPDITNLQAIRCYEKAGFMHTIYSENPDYLILTKVINAL